MSGALDTAAAPRGGLLRRAFMRHPWAFGVAFGLILIPAMRPLLRRVPEPPPVYGALPPFTLTDHLGEPLTRESLLGHVWVASFIFTSCPSTCPAVTSAMAELQRRFADAEVPVRLVSVTVDPETDTVARLAAYAAEHGVDPARWRFATADEAAIRALVVDGFKTAMGEKVAEGEGPVDIAHSTKLALVDAQGRLRGWYPSSTLGVDEVFHRAQHVLAQAAEEAR